MNSWDPAERLEAIDGCRDIRREKRNKQDRRPPRRNKPVALAASYLCARKKRSSPVIDELPFTDIYCQRGQSRSRLRIQLSQPHGRKPPTVRNQNSGNLPTNHGRVRHKTIGSTTHGSKFLRGDSSNYASYMRFPVEPSPLPLWYRYSLFQVETVSEGATLVWNKL